ncbi:MAG: tetratricopeptide repeat protein [Acidobacteriota bacterium]
MRAPWMSSITMMALFVFTLPAVGQSADQGFKPQPLLEQGVALLKKGEADQAEPLLRQAALAAPEDALVYFYLGSAQMAQSEYSDAASSLRRALRLNEANSSLGRANWREAQDNLGLALAFQQEYGQAKKVYEAALAKDPDYPPFSYNLACVCSRAGDRLGAIAALREALLVDARQESGPTLPDPSVDQDLKGLLGDPRFQATLLVAIGPQPNDGPGSALMREGARLLSAGEDAAAEAKERAAIAAEPSSPRAWFFLGGALEEQKRLPEAAEAYAKALAADNPPGRVLSKPMRRHALMAEGMAALAKGQGEAAVGFFQAASALDPFHPMAFYDLGRAFALQGKMKEAAQAVRKAEDLKDNLTAVEGPLPDPAKDPAFDRWSKDPAWRALLSGETAAPSAGAPKAPVP